jgi:hypothetical protein
MKVTLVDIDSHMFGARAPASDVGLFAFDRDMLGNLDRLRGKQEFFSGIFAVEEDDTWGTGAPATYKSICIASVVNGSCYIPQNSAFYDLMPMDDLRMLGVRITRRCQFLEEPTKPENVKAKEQSENFSRWFQFFKTPTSSWGQASSYHEDCDCGARYTSFPTIHLQFCRKFKP